MRTLFVKPKREIDRIFIHCTATENASYNNIERIREDHMLNRGWSDIGYHFLITKDGTIHKGRSLEQIPAAQRGHNRRSIAIVLAGLRKEKFTLAQSEGLKALCGDINKSYFNKVSFHGHCEVASKACPVIDYKTILKLDEFGSLGLDVFRESVLNNVRSSNIHELPELRTGSRGESVKFLQELLLIKIDGIFGSATARAVREFKKAHNLYASDVVKSHVWRLLIDVNHIEHYD
jgi:N-acetyl-anhydromuramyl-L-alanine amidase AmpD